MYLEDGVLILTGELNWSVTAQFDEQCQKLTESDAAELFVDLTDVSVITSPFLGILSQVAVQCLGRNKPITFRVPTKHLSLFHALQFEKLAHIRVV